MSFDEIQIIVPVYNEADNILNTLGELREKVKTAYTILIIYDFDGDNTLPVVRGHIAEHGCTNIRLIRNKYSGGVLNAIKTGLRSVLTG